MVLDFFTARCRKCESTVSAFAPTCSLCGAPNAARLSAFLAAGSVLALLVAIAVAAFVVLRGVRIDAPPRTGDDFAWLIKAMEECDAEAAQVPETLHFLVIPMASNPADENAWLKKSLNDVGNAFLLTQQLTIEGLMNGGLRISTEEYDFRLLDEGTNDVYRWTPSTGVKKFFSPQAAQIKTFKVQFRTARRPNDAWGAAFVNALGTCYWVNAVIGT